MSQYDSRWDSTLANDDSSAIAGGRRRASTSTSRGSLDSPLQPPFPPTAAMPSSLANWDMSPGSGGIGGGGGSGSGSGSASGDKVKQPFKSKSKHNLAIFGAKLSSTAASVGVHTSKYKHNKDLNKEQHRESVFAETPESHPFDPSAIIGSPLSLSSPRENGGLLISDGGGVHPGVGGSGAGGLGSSHGAGAETGRSLSGSGSSGLGGGGGGLKSKMFKQSKTDLKSLKIKTDLGIHAARSSLNDRSPMARGGSNKELDRIAALGQQPHSPLQPEFNFGHSSNLGHYHLHPPHLSFRKRDSPAAVLSSSASNSTLASEGTVYSFNQANANGSASVATASHHSFKTQEEATAFLTSSWTLLNLRIQPVFKRDEALRIPVEDVNILVFMHFTAHHEQGGTGLELLNKLDELLQTGLLASNSVAPAQPTLEALAESWRFFYSKTLLALESIFLPLQLELDGMGQVFTNSRAANEYWFPLIGRRSSAFNKNHAFRRKSQRPNIRRRVLTVYRDIAVVPILPSINKLLMEWGSASGVNPEAIPSHGTVVNLLQCLTVLSNLKTSGDAQAAVDSALLLLSKNTARQVQIRANERANEERVTLVM